MKRARLGSAVALLGVLFQCTLGCGTKQPVKEIQLPTLVLPEAGTCPGALPGGNIQVTTAIGESNAPVVAWTGDAFAVAWWDLRGQSPEVRLMRIDKNGVNRSPAERVPSKGPSKGQRLAWDGKEGHLVFRDGEGIAAMRVGSTNTAPTILAEKGAMPAAAGFGAAVWVNTGNIFFRSDGMMRPSNRPQKDPNPVVIASGGIEDPDIAFNGQFYAVVWSTSVAGGRDILLQRVSPAGKKIGGVVRVSSIAGSSRKPRVVWSGKHFGVAWTHAAPATENPRDRFQVFFAIVPETGDTPILTRQLAFRGSADQVALAATGEEFGLAWVGSRQPMGTAVYLQRISPAGQPLEETTEVTDGVPFTCGRPDLAWDGAGYAVVWHDDRAPTGTEVFFAYVACGEAFAPAPPPPPKTPPDLKDAFDESEDMVE
ncbi:MAG: hypothetical protein QNJ97_08205 [Myxococcota bacterium]|nr:hypothetical protein [Myxococcota bacterium]